ncbi:Two component transcriptional regulator, winged helix family [Candidatus Terasakiella magnetica]|uniref:Two component transcriptional regulator, winged helix family n=1 Tax=Candidatus Terasakiella magnetica TaxID=1867952 RepID=A0A1C3RI75_9PROT|nr:response regulator transcription factor [Candidatus Terasakiella magnetica]SCA56955.1 Two component transcriptional regulator, winged helix family [Candidatus Terasakiella magnetica]
MHVVVVEDHDALRDITATVLREEGYFVTDLAYAEDVDGIVDGSPIDIIVIDLNLPGEDGISLAKRLRKAHPLVGIIMMTARDSAKDMAIGYDSGADVYLVKPILPETLLSVIGSLQRRLHSTIEGQSAKLNQAENLLVGPKGDATLQEAETKLLTACMRAANCELEYGQVAKIFGMDEVGYNKKNLEVRIVRLRKKLKEVTAGKVNICSVRLKGYKLTKPLKIY